MEANGQTTLHIVRGCISVLCVVAGTSCGWRPTTVEYVSDDGYAFSRAEKRAIEAIVEATAEEVRQFLPALPNRLLIRVRTGRNVIPETGETANAIPPDYVSWTVDPTRDGGVKATADRELRRTLFHEFHHLVRQQTIRGQSLLNRAVTEGMATAFERDSAGAPAPWGRYPDNVADWVTEFMALPSDASQDDWMSKHPDGRRWIGYKVGTYLVDQAVVSSGLTPAELVVTPAEEVVAMAVGR